MLASLVGLSSSKDSNSKVNFKLGLLGLLKLRVVFFTDFKTLFLKIGKAEVLAENYEYITTV